jgi:hypothetical protein
MLSDDALTLGHGTPSVRKKIVLHCTSSIAIYFSFCDSDPELIRFDSCFWKWNEGISHIREVILVCLFRHNTLTREMFSRS